MTIFALTGMLLAAVAQQPTVEDAVAAGEAAAIAVGNAAAEAEKKQMCTKLKAEGDRQLAIMQNGPDPDKSRSTGKFVEDEMKALGERQGRSAIALGAVQAIAGAAGNVAGVAAAGRANDMMAKADLLDRNRLLEIAQKQNEEDSKAQNAAGDRFIEITSRYRRLGCPSPTGMQAPPPGFGAGAEGSSGTAGDAEFDTMIDELLGPNEKAPAKKEGVYTGQPR